MTVVKFTQKEWDDMRFLQDDIRFMKRNNVEGKWDHAIDSEQRMLRKAIQNAA